MPLFEKDTRSTLLGVGVGAGAILVLPYVGPVLAAIARPLTKALIATGITGFEKATEKLALAAESFQDIVAEVRAERSAAEVLAAAPAAQAPEASQRAN